MNVSFCSFYTHLTKQELGTDLGIIVIVSNTSKENFMLSQSFQQLRFLKKEKVIYEYIFYITKLHKNEKNRCKTKLMKSSY